MFFSHGVSLPKVKKWREPGSPQAKLGGVVLFLLLFLHWGVKTPKTRVIQLCCQAVGFVLHAPVFLWRVPAGLCLHLSLTPQLFP